MRLERRYLSPQEADRIWRAVKADNPPYVNGRTEGDRLVIEVANENPKSLRATLDDLIACLAVAERTPDPSVRPPRP